MLVLVTVLFSFMTINVYANDTNDLLTTVNEDLNQPMGMDIVDDGLYLADSYNNQIIQIVNGEKILVAGNNDLKDIFGLPLGGLVDGGAEDAYFNRPRDLVVSSDGLIFVADTDNHVIRKIESGQVTTYAGSGLAGYADGSSSEAAFNKPSGLVLDSEGRLIITDMLNDKIRIIDVDGTVSTMVLTSEDNSHILNEPSDIVALDNGDFIIVDSGQQVVKKISDGNVSVLSGLWDGQVNDGYRQAGYVDGQNDQAQYAFPKALAEEDGVVYVADTWNHSIRIIKADGSVTSLIGNGVAGNDLSEGASSLNTPSGLAVNEGVLYIADRYNNRVVSMDLAYGSPAFDLSIEAFTDINEDQVDVQVDGEFIDFTDVEPVTLENLTYYPVRSIAEGLGMEVSYLEATRQARIVAGETSVTYSIDDERGTILNNRFMMPIRDLATDLEVFLSVNEASSDVWISQPTATK